MKKILGLVITLLLVLGVGACVKAPTDTDLEDRVTILEEQVLELENILIDLEVIEGLNGQREYYLPQKSVSVFQTTSVSAYTMETLGDELDKSKAPNYVLDENENYIPFSTVVDLLIEKYFGNDIDIKIALIGFQIKITLEVNDISENEYMAKMIMLINELSNYDFYIIGGSELYIQSDFSGTSYIKIPIQTMRSSFINITPEVIYNGLYEIRLVQHTFSTVSVQALYDEYMLSELYDGYVLDYN